MWKEELAEKLPLLGHRNWIAVVDKAFPLQSAPGITTVYSGDSIEDTLSSVIAMLDAQHHIAPKYWVDAELQAMNDDLSPGAVDLKTRYSSVFQAKELKSIPHEEIFDMFLEASRRFSVYVIKTNCLIPYTSVFIELDCGYWNSRSEEILRNLLEKE